MNAQSLWEDLQLLREKKPLVHNITNYVAMNATANALLAVGASPVMAHASAEVESLASVASALVINIGTLSDPWVASMRLAVEKAKEQGTPRVFDPVGCGATDYRTRVARELVTLGEFSVIRGNASEILSLGKEGGATKGVDSTEGSDKALHAAKHISQEWNAIVVVSGAKDYVVSAEKSWVLSNGSALMEKVTAMGCTATAIIGAFAGVTPDPVRAAVHGMAVMGLCGQWAAERSKYPGSFFVSFLDALSALDFPYIEETLCLEQANGI